MTIRTILESMSTFSDSERKSLLGPLCRSLSEVSMQTLRAFQSSWDSNRPFSEFVTEQNRVIRECVQIEMTSIGLDVRAIMGLPLLTMDTEITADTQ